MCRMSLAAGLLTLCLALPASTNSASAQQIVTYYSYVSPAPVMVGPPTVVYAGRPVVVAPSFVPATPLIYPARPIVARTKYYVPGQPVRNFWRAVTP